MMLIADNDRTDSTEIYAQTAVQHLGTTPLLDWLQSFKQFSLMCHTVILLPAHPASFAHNFVSGMQSFYFSESKDAIVLQTCH